MCKVKNTISSKYYTKFADISEYEFRIDSITLQVYENGRKELL